MSNILNTDIKELIIETIATHQILDEIDSIRIGDYSVIYEKFVGDSKPLNEYTDEKLLEELKDICLPLDEWLIKKYLRYCQDRLKTLNESVIVGKVNIRDFVKETRETGNDDCGSDTYIQVYIKDQKTLNQFIGRWYMNDNKLTQIDATDSKFFGKTVSLRTPMFCKDKDNSGFCKTCMGLDIN